MRARIIAASGDVSHRSGLRHRRHRGHHPLQFHLLRAVAAARTAPRSSRSRMTDLSFVLGDPSDPGLRTQRPQWPLPDHAAGHGGPHRTQCYSTTINGDGANIEISGNLAVEINTTNAVVNETFVIDSLANTTTSCRAEGSVPAAVRFPVAAASPSTMRQCRMPFVLSRQLRLRADHAGRPEPGVTTSPAPKAIRVAASDVTVSVLGCRPDDGQGGFIFSPDGIAGQMRVTVDAQHRRSWRCQRSAATCCCRSTPPGGGEPDHRGRQHQSSPSSSRPPRAMWCVSRSSTPASRCRRSSN
jgi:hypothetical protein